MNEKTLQRIKRQAKNDYYFLCREILGYKKMTPVPHRELCNFIEHTKKRKKLCLMPRGSFKSSVVTVGFAIRAMIRDPNIRILIASETQKNAKKYVKEIKTQIESNEKLRAIFGSWVSQDNTWKDDEFIISTRTQPKKESTVFATSLERVNITGQHYDLIILDDVVGPNTVGTPNQISKTLDYYRLLLSILDPGPEKRIIVLGTRYSIQDLYGWILDPSNQEQDQFDIMVRAAYNEDGTLLMPDVLTEEFLSEQKKTQGTQIFNNQYLNKAQSDETKTFKDEQIRFFDKAPSNLYYFMSIDPAISMGAKSDYSAIIVNGVDYDHNWYILEAMQLKVDPSDLISMIFLLAEKYQLQCCAMEKFAIEKFLKVNLEREMEKKEFYFPLKDVETSTKISKEARIRALQPRFQNGTIFVKRDQDALLHQLYNHPQVKNDDLVDALKTQLQITYPSDFKDKGFESKQYQHLPRIDRMAWEHVKSLGQKRRFVIRTRKAY